MTDTVLPTHEALLSLCAAAAPDPWYPRVYARTSGVERDSLDEPLNEMRLAGLIRLTDWVRDVGQGYVLTDLGEEVLKNPAQFAQLRSGAPAPTSERIVEKAKDDYPTVPTRFERGEQARAALYRPDPPRVMPILLLVNLIAFAISFYAAIRAGVPIGQFASEGDTRVLHELGALSSHDLIRGDWWRLLTACFLHFGLVHLLLNMYSLYALGLLESLWGPSRFLLLYLCSGIGGNCVAMLYNPGSPNEIALLAGASGAIWGLMTSLVAWVLVNRSHLPPEDLARWFPRIGLIFLINVGVSFLPGVSAGAHFGGGAVGFIMATLLHVQRIAPPPRRTAAVVLIVMLPFLCIAAVSEAIEKDPRWQRIVEAEKDRERKSAALYFKMDVLPAVDKADAAFGSLQTSAYIVMDQAPAQRPPEKVQFVRSDVRNVRGLVENALHLLENPIGDEKLQTAAAAGTEYMKYLAELLDKIENILEQQKVWDKDERSTIEPMRKKLRIQWLSARNSP